MLAELHQVVDLAELAVPVVAHIAIIRLVFLAHRELLGRVILAVLRLPLAFLPLTRRGVAAQALLVRRAGLEIPEAV